MRRTRSMMLVAALMTLVGGVGAPMIGCTESTIPDTPGLSEPTAPVLAHWGIALGQSEFGNVVASGYIRNDDTRPVDVEAEATWYDQGGNIIGRSSDYMFNLGPGETWRYSVMFTEIGVPASRVSKAMVKPRAVWR